MTYGLGPSGSHLAEIREEMERDLDSAITRARIGLTVRAALIVVVVGCMAWIYDSVSRVDAAALARLASESVVERIPRLRTEFRDYAVRIAPVVNDHAQDMLLGVPGRVRDGLEQRLLAHTDRLIVRLYSDVDSALNVAVRDELRRMRASPTEVTPEERMSVLVDRVREVFRESSMETIDEMYGESSREIRRLRVYLHRLSRGELLTDAEKLDRRLIEAWAALVLDRGVALDGDVIRAFQPS